MQYLKIEADREGYTPQQVATSTMKVGDLIDYLQGFPEDLPVILSHDNGYTFGGVYYHKVLDDDYSDE